MLVCGIMNNNSNNMNNKQKFTGAPKNLGIDTFPNQSFNFWPQSGGFWFCRRCVISGSERVPLAPPGWYPNFKGRFVGSTTATLTTTTLKQQHEQQQQQKQQQYQEQQKQPFIYYWPDFEKLLMEGFWDKTTTKTAISSSTTSLTTTTTTEQQQIYLSN